MSYNNKLATASILAAAMVVSIHVASMSSPQASELVWWLNTCLADFGVARVAVPFFFVCSGFFLARHTHEAGWWKTALRKRAKSLLVPYILWSVIAVLPHFVLLIAANCVHLRAAGANCDNLTMPQWQSVLGVDIFHEPNLWTLWFLRALMMYVVLSPLIVRWVQKTDIWGLGLLFLGWFLVTFLYRNPRVYGFCDSFFSIQGLFFFSLGCWISKNTERAKKIEQWLFAQRWMLLLAGLGAVLANALYMVISDRGPLDILMPIYATSLLAAFWSFVPSESAWAKSSAGVAFATYLLHPFVWQVFERFCSLDVTGVCMWILKWAIGFGGSWVIAVILFRTVPRFADILFGGRR